LIFHFWTPCPSWPALAWSLDLGEAQKKIQAVLKNIAAPPKGSTVTVRGEVPALEDTISGLRIGLLLAIASIFLLLMANFQSLRLPLVILSTIPGVLCDVVLMLLLNEGTPLLAVGSV
jgi:multidrug efflux pump subunit AcrB